MYVDSLPTACSCWWWWFRGFFLPFYCHLERRGVKTWLTWHFQSTYQKFLRWKTNQPFLTWRFYLFFFSTPSLLPHFNCSRGSDMCICTEEEMEEREREVRGMPIYRGLWIFICSSVGILRTYTTAAAGRRVCCIILKREYFMYIYFKLFRSSSERGRRRRRK